MKSYCKLLLVVVEITLIASNKTWGCANSWGCRILAATCSLPSSSLQNNSLIIPSASPMAYIILFGWNKWIMYAAGNWPMSAMAHGETPLHDILEKWCWLRWRERTNKSRVRPSVHEHHSCHTIKQVFSNALLGNVPLHLCSKDRHACLIVKVKGSKLIRHLPIHYWSGRASQVSKVDFCQDILSLIVASWLCNKRRT